MDDEAKAEYDRLRYLEKKAAYRKALAAGDPQAIEQSLAAKVLEKGRWDALKSDSASLTRHQGYCREWARNRRARDPEWRAKQNERTAEYAARPENKARKKALRQFEYLRNRETILAQKKLDYQRPEYVAQRRVYSKVTGWARTLVNSARRAHRNAQKKHGPMTISTQWVEEQFERQGGKCFWSGLPMVIVAKARTIRMPSLDRVDSKKGYTVDNVVICTWAMNAAKSTASAEEFREFLRDLRAAA